MNYIITLTENMEEDLGYAMRAHKKKGKGVVLRTGWALANRGLVEVSNVGFVTTYRITCLGVEVANRILSANVLN